MIRRRFLAQLLAGALGATVLGAWRRAFADTISYTYDSLGRIATATFSNGATITYSYDAAGNRTVLQQTPPNAVQATLVADPTAIAPGQSTTLTWTTSFATDATIDQGIGTVTPTAGGSMQVSPSTTTTYTLTASGPSGPAVAQATVTVSDPTFNATIAVTGTGPVNLRTLANNAGYNGTQSATIVFEVGSGVTLTGTAGAPNGAIAIDTGTWPGAPLTIALTLVVKGGAIVRGGGGRGGNGGAVPGAGGTGGDAIYCQHPISITIESTGQVRGGGGGGGGASSVSEGWPEPEDRPGGGGGGGAPNGPGGAGDFGAANGGNGTVSGGGAGGAGANGGVSGGAGGTFGVSGSNGQGWLNPPAPGGTAGTAGYAIRKNGHTVPVTNNGSTSGTIG